MTYEFFSAVKIGNFVQFYLGLYPKNDVSPNGEISIGNVKESYRPKIHTGYSYLTWSGYILSNGTVKARNIRGSAASSTTPLYVSGMYPLNN